MKVIILCGNAIVCLLLTIAVLHNAATKTVADTRITYSSETLKLAARIFSNSARVQARFAGSELETVLERGQACIHAEIAAEQAVNLVPKDYQLWLLLASAYEAAGKTEKEEAALRTAVSLAPNYTETHWLLANFLIRAGRLNEALTEFRTATVSDKKLLTAAFYLVWHASEGKIPLLNQITGERSEARLALADFLLSINKTDDAVDIYSRIDRQSRLSSEQAGKFLNQLIAAGQIETAYSLWMDLMESKNSPGIWNGSFEVTAKRGFQQFDWIVDNSEYAQLSIASDVARTGSKSLKLIFAGKHTTRLDAELKQVVVLQPGATYRLECYEKAAELITTKGPQVAVTGLLPTNWSESSSPIEGGTHDWRRLAIDFTAPIGLSAVLVKIKRTPEFSYDEPLKGIVWFDDFRLIKLK